MTYEWIIVSGICGAAALLGLLGIAVYQRNRERKEAQKQRDTWELRRQSLEQQIAFFADAIDRIPAGIWVKRMDEDLPCYVVWNHAMTALSGFSPGDVLGKRDNEIYPPEQADLYRKSDFELMQTGLPRKMRMDETLDAEGHLHFIQVTKTPLFDGKRNICAILGMVEDMTDRVKAVETLRASETRLRHVLDIAPIGICQTSRKGDRLLYANPATAQLFGFRNVEELLKAAEETDLDRLFYAHPAERERLVSDFLQSGRGWELFNITFRRKNGDPFSAHLYLCLREGGLPGNEFFYAFIEDVSEQCKTEEENTLLHRELEHVARVNTMGQLAASIAHEINQPLAAILSNAQAAQRLMQMDRPDLNEVKNILHDIIHDDRRAAEVIQKMRALLKRKIADVIPVDVNPVIENVAALIRGELEGKRIDLRLQLDTDIPPVSGDPVQLQQVFLNLLTNAMESMENTPPDMRMLTITTGACMGMVEIRVSDMGIGLSPQEMNQIFEPFYTTKENGLGMGLAINKTIIRALGGQLEVQPNPERGVTFFVRLPVERTGAGEPAQQ